MSRRGRTWTVVIASVDIVSYVTSHSNKILLIRIWPCDILIEFKMLCWSADWFGVVLEMRALLWYIKYFTNMVFSMFEIHLRHWAKKNQTHFSMISPLRFKWKHSLFFLRYKSMTICTALKFGEQSKDARVVLELMQCVTMQTRPI